PSTFMPFTFSTNAGGKVFSMPNKIPIFFITKLLSHKQCHPERGSCFAKRISYAVEGPLQYSTLERRCKAFSRALQTNRPASQKYFTAILCHKGQSCFELSPHTSSQCGTAFSF